MASIVKNAVYLQNHVSCPFPVDTSCILPQMHPWSTFFVFLFLLQNHVSFIHNAIGPS